MKRDSFIFYRSFQEAIDCAPEEKKLEIYKNITNICPNIILKGVMSIGANSEDEKKIKESFMITKEIFDLLKPFDARYCSMGMSGDFELAIACGSNLIRVGSTLFKNL